MKGYMIMSITPLLLIAIAGSNRLISSCTCDLNCLLIFKATKPFSAESNLELNEGTTNGKYCEFRTVNNSETAYCDAGAALVSLLGSWGGLTALATGVTGEGAVGVVEVPTVGTGAGVGRDTLVLSI